MDFYIQLGGNNKRYFQRSPYMLQSDKDSFNKFTEKFKNTDVYYSVFAYYDKEDVENCPLYGPLYFDLDTDLDTEQGFKDVKKDTLLVIEYLRQDLKIPLEYIRIYFSGAKGFHVLVPPEVFGTPPEENLNVIYKVIALTANKNTVHKRIDPQIYDRRRLFRIPNTVNRKTGLYKVPISLKTFRDMNLASIRKYAEKPKKLHAPPPGLVKEARDKYFELLYKLYTAKKRKRKKRNGPPPGYEKELLPCVEAILAEGVSEGVRNEVTVGTANSLFQAGYDYDEVLQIMEEWDSRNTPPVYEEDPKEIERTVANGYRTFSTEKFYGCSHFKGMGYCVEDCFINGRG